jgi:hypothetical protein
LFYEYQCCIRLINPSGRADQLQIVAGVIGLKAACERAAQFPNTKDGIAAMRVPLENTRRAILRSSGEGALNLRLDHLGELGGNMGIDGQFLAIVTLMVAAEEGLQPAPFILSLLKNYEVFVRDQNTQQGQSGRHRKLFDGLLALIDVARDRVDCREKSAVMFDAHVQRKEVERPEPLGAR